MTAAAAKKKLSALASPDIAKSAARFFKTGPGEYGEGDSFIGIPVPTLRSVSREFKGMPLEDIETLLRSPIHEHRHLALLILVLQVAKCAEAHRSAVFDFYLRNMRFINNWDLVDCSAPQVVGGFLWNKPRTPLYRLAKSKLLWERRVAIVSTQHFIRQGDLADTLTISQRLLDDLEDLIHKASGWMLREAGKKDQAVLLGFLDEHAAAMPRTMLRYAIERLPAELRQAYMSMRDGRVKEDARGAKAAPVKRKPRR